MCASGLSDYGRRHAQVLNEKAAHVAFTHSQAIRKLANRMLVKESISNESKSVIDGGGCAVPGGGSGRCLRPAPLARPKSRLLRRGRTKKESDVLAFRRPGRTDGSAVGPRRRHGSEELAVKTGVSGLDDAVADVRVQLHDLYILIFPRCVWRFSDMATPAGSATFLIRSTLRSTNQRWFCRSILGFQSEHAMRYCLLHLGCQMNKSDAERVRTVIEGLGYERTDDETEADLLGIVACSVRQRAIDKAYARIRAWNSWKANRNLLTFVTGCMLPSDREKFLTLFDLVFDITEIPHVPDLIRQYGVVTPVGIHAVIPVESLQDASGGFWRITPRYSSSFEAYVPIQNGCDKFCTFCAVPYTRGREISRPSQEILQEVSRLVERGYKSITLLGQNVNSYGLDRKGLEITFAELLRGIGEIGNASGREFWVYFTSPHPRDMTEEVIRVIAGYPCLAKQIHLPLQSGDDRILIRMNRNYMVDQYRETVAMIRSIIPNATLFTDIIVGFSGETEAAFESTRKAMQEFQYNMAYVAMYSPRPGAASYRWPDDVPHEEKNSRLHVLSGELAATSGAYNRTMIGREYRVLVEGADRKEGYLSAKTEGRIIVRFPSADRSLMGQFTTVKITQAAALSVEGEMVGTLAPVLAE